MELLSYEEGMRYVVQPFDTILNYHPYKHLLPTPQCGHFIFPDEREREQIFEFFLKLKNRNILVNPQWKVWKSNFSFVSNRCVYKLFYVKDLIDEFSRRFRIKIIYLIRHPIPTSLSNIKRRWPSPAEAFLNNQAFCSNYLSKAQVELSTEIVNRGSMLEKHVLGWCLENTVPLKVVNERDWLFLKYEQMVLEPEQTLRKLCDKLDLKSYEKLLRHYNDASFTTDKESAAVILQRQKEKLLYGWKQRVSRDQNPLLNDIFHTMCEGVYEGI
jgi:Sulfotransferase domain